MPKVETSTSKQGTIDSYFKPTAMMSSAADFASQDAQGVIPGSAAGPGSEDAQGVFPVSAASLGSQDAQGVFPETQFGDFGTMAHENHLSQQSLNHAFPGSDKADSLPSIIEQIGAGNAVECLQKLVGTDVNQNNVDDVTARLKASSEVCKPTSARRFVLCKPGFRPP
jgi:hypothetical protein